MGDPLRYHPLVQAKCNWREKYFSVVKIGIKTGLVIHTENVKIQNYIINIPCILKDKICYTDKISLTRVNSFTDKITS